jgi:sulfur-carrier protein adenylyltransferase/sulfurtransferase
MKEISVKELKEKLDKSEDLQLIDVREPHEAEQLAMGGELIPMGDVMDNLEKISRSKPVIVHCKSGMRSAAIVQALEKQGFENVYNLKGGIMAWVSEIDPSLVK